MVFLGFVFFLIKTFAISHAAVHQSSATRMPVLPLGCSGVRSYMCPKHSTPAPQLSPPSWLCWNDTLLGFPYVQSAVCGALSCSQEC